MRFGHFTATPRGYPIGGPQFNPLLHSYGFQQLPANSPLNADHRTKHLDVPLRVSTPKRWRAVQRIEAGKAFGLRENRTTDWDVRLRAASSAAIACSIGRSISPGVCEYFRGRKAGTPRRSVLGPKGTVLEPDHLPHLIQQTLLAIAIDPRNG